MASLMYLPLGTTAKALPAIPGLEQGDPTVSNRQAQAQAGRPADQAAAAASGQAAGQGQAPPPQPPTPQQIRDQIRQSIQQGGQPQIVIPNDFTNAVPQGAVDISIALFVTLAAVIIFRPIVGALVRRSDARNQALASGVEHLGPQIAQLQQSVDAMAVELERISEAQRFQSRLLAGREKEEAPIER